MKKSLDINVIIIYSTLYLLSAILSIMHGSIELFDYNNSDFNYEIFHEILILRITNFLIASFIGVCLAICGNVLQNILKNPLADPFILGISAGGTCFAAGSMFFSSSFILLQFPLEYNFSLQTVAAFIGCLFSFTILFWARKKIQGSNDDYIYPVIGIITNTFFSAILMLIFSISKPEKLSEIQNFLVGSLQPITFSELIIVIIISIFPIFMLFNRSQYFNKILFGDDFAKSLGVSSEKIRKECIFYVCVIISLVVSLAGSISFIGLIVPHIVRKVHRVGHRSELIICMFLGAIILVNADTLARTVLKPAQLPVGIFTALIGAPFLAIILLKRNKS